MAPSHSCQECPFLPFLPFLASMPRQEYPFLPFLECADSNGRFLAHTTATPAPARGRRRRQRLTCALQLVLQKLVEKREEVSPFHLVPADLPPVGSDVVLGLFLQAFELLLRLVEARGRAQGFGQVDLVALRICDPGEGNTHHARARGVSVDVHPRTGRTGFRSLSQRGTQGSLTCG